MFEWGISDLRQEFSKPTIRVHTKCMGRDQCGMEDCARCAPSNFDENGNFIEQQEDEQ